MSAPFWMVHSFASLSKILSERKTKRLLCVCDFSHMSSNCTQMLFLWRWQVWSRFNATLILMETYGLLYTNDPSVINAIYCIFVPNNTQNGRCWYKHVLEGEMHNILNRIFQPNNSSKCPAVHQNEVKSSCFCLDFSITQSITNKQALGSWQAYYWLLMSHDYGNKVHRGQLTSHIHMCPLR